MQQRDIAGLQLLVAECQQYVITMKYLVMHLPVFIWENVMTFLSQHLSKIIQQMYGSEQVSSHLTHSVKHGQLQLQLLETYLKNRKRVSKQ